MEKLIRLIEWFLLWNTVLINISIRDCSIWGQIRAEFGEHARPRQRPCPNFVFWTSKSNRADMMGLLAEQHKLDGIPNIKKIFSTEKLLLRASSFLFQIKYSHCKYCIHRSHTAYVISYKSYHMGHIVCAITIIEVTVTIELFRQQI